MNARGPQALPGSEHIDSLEAFRSRYGHRYTKHLAECEQRLSEIAGRPEDELADSCTMTLSAGGKRLRPLLVFLFSQTGSVYAEQHYAAAVAVEMVHMATLVHDDVLDDADLRRGKPTVKARYGTGVSIAAGDYLFASAFDMLTEAASTRAVSMLARTSLDLSLGELLQMSAAGDTRLSRDRYEERCRLKTSSLFSTACALGALLSGLSEEVIGSASEYGECLGLAFQISDDILDYSDDTESTGKRLGTDLMDGTVTLPLILAIERDPDITGLLTKQLDEDRLEMVAARVRESGGLEAARHRAVEFVAAAIKALQSLDSVLDVEPLKLIANATVDRRS